jgi:peptide/nickel transport system substrate-binding protein
MFRGFRWQFFALIAALVLFVVALITRINVSQTVNPPPTIASTTQPTQSIAITATDIPPQAVQSGSQPTPAPGDPNRIAGVLTYREAVIGSIQRLNPVFAAYNAVDHDITSLIFEGLTRSNEYGEARPALAQRWVISSDALEYTFFLRQDVLWQDGNPFTANDVAYTMSILRAPDFPGDRDLNRFWRTVETELLDVHTVRFRLTQPLSTFLDKVGIGMLPEHALRGTSAAALAAHPFNLTPIGTGAYQLEAIRTDESGAVRAVDLRAAPVYRLRPEGQAQPFAIDRVRFQLFDTFENALAALESGAVDGLASRNRADRRPLFLSANTANLAPYNAIDPVFGALIFNWVDDSTRFFRERGVRRALEIGLDRAAMIDRALSNSAVLADSPIPVGSWAYLAALPYPAYDPAESRRLLALAAERYQNPEADENADSTEATGEPASTDTVDVQLAPSGLFAFTILIPDDPALSGLASEIASQWSQLGLTVTVDAVAREQYQLRLEAHDFDSALVEYSMRGSSDPDPFAFWHQGEYPDGENYGGADDRIISELLERARRDASGINRIGYYHDFQRTFIDRAIAIPLYFPVFTYVTTPRLQNLQLGYVGAPYDRFRSIGMWSLN